MQHIRLFYTDRVEIGMATARQWLGELPAAEAERIRAFKHSEDARDRLLGGRLVLYAAHQLGLDDFKLKDIEFLPGEKPRTRDFQFSISHSGGLIVCAAHRSSRVGVDVERVSREIPQPPPFMSATEITAITDEPASFYSYWTAKEAVCKAAEAGGLAAMGRVSLDHGVAILDKQRWFIHTFEIQPGFVTSLACESEGFSDEVQAVDPQH